MHQMQAFYIASSSYGQQPNGTKYFELNGRIITHDGTDFGWANIVIEINLFEGARPLTSLDAFPLKYLAEREAVSDRLVARARRYVSIVDQPTCFEYAGAHPTKATDIKETVLPGRQGKPEKFNVSDKIDRCC